MNDSAGPAGADRRQFITQSGLLLGAAVAGSSLSLLGCADNAGQTAGAAAQEPGKASDEKEGGEDVSANEDLMREHGLLKRVLIMYDTMADRVTGGQELDRDVAAQSAGIIREFVEDYHERIEEQHLFARFLKAGKMTELVNTLQVQHDRGRILTSRMLLALKAPRLSKAAQQQVVADMRQFYRMYTPHEAREDTELYPALHQLVSRHEYDSMGEEFEKIEHQKFGQGGFELYLSKVTDLEKKLGTWDLNQYTPII
ncbi:hemerythrin domain-containing protein [Hymenobacter lapidiphilus]|uniref:Hemerythrin domain-containing protein n=1 Tax=Hymenobacter lapidiphilus TaxID=2608003 RepID=A0A7Y7U5A9_9BACT|nr:hemerythrin domain-containing protein [Hymenobacter lapidiphilus]NVO30270.1 hemerythrin domain-containing protein [Hymenobacter lapidiphilus]